MDATVPTYHGPFSTTTSADVADGFADGHGLIFSVKGSYSNPIRFILGIDMIRISCFKHEREILLYSQTLPIKSTKTFAVDEQEKIDHMMHSVKSTKTQITDRKTFLKKIGVRSVRFSMEWIQLIAKHSLLKEKSEYGPRKGKKRTVEERLIKELRLIPLLLHQQRDKFIFRKFAFQMSTESKSIVRKNLTT